MRALAEFIMRGRTQAAAVALIGHWIPLLSPAAVALVALRRGTADGLLVLLWALMPALVYVAVGQYSAALAIVGAISVCASALILRACARWQYTLMGLVACNALGVLLIGLAFPQLVSALVEKAGEFFSQLRMQSSETLALPEPDATLVLGWLAAMGAASGALALFLGRWWQSLLYNPGGFGEEFRAFRLSPVAATVCMVAVVYCYWRPGNLEVWALLFAQPLLFAGIALIHALLKARGMGTPWLVMFYCALVLLQPLKILLVLVAFGDTWLDFRARVKAKKP